MPSDPHGVEQLAITEIDDMLSRHAEQLGRITGRDHRVFQG